MIIIRLDMMIVVREALISIRITVIPKLLIQMIKSIRSIATTEITMVTTVDIMRMTYVEPLEGSFVDSTIKDFEVWAHIFGPDLFLPCYSGLYSVGPYSEMVYTAYTRIPDCGFILSAHCFDDRQ